MAITRHLMSENRAITVQRFNPGFSTLILDLLRGSSFALSQRVFASTFRHGIYTSNRIQSGILMLTSHVVCTRGETMNMDSN